MFEIIFHGRGGHGVVAAAKLLASAAAKSGSQVQSFAAYGAERRGGVVESYVRMAEDKIFVHCKMYEPDFIILMDESFAKDPKVVASIRKGGTVLINTPEPASKFSSLKDSHVITIDAKQIALEKKLTLPSGMPVINTPILGAVAGLIPSIELVHLNEALREGKIPALEKNIAAAQEAYQRVKGVAAGLTTRVAEAPWVITERYPAYQTKMPPCEANCPAGEEIERTAYFIQNRRFDEALESIKAENPFPGICGRVCFHPCEANCNRNQYDEGVATNALEWAAFDYADPTAVHKPVKRPPSGKRVAVIGSGPGGLTCAYYLSLLGHKVTVFEAQPVAGGIPRFGIPEYRLPEDIVCREVKEIAELSVDIKVNTEVGKDIAFDAITKEYGACFIAAGAHRSMKLDIPGEDSAGVISGLDLLKRVTFGEKIELDSKVAVIGGGNTAIDAARTARRLGASEVTIIYRRSAEEMPAHKEEVTAAKKEGIKILYLAMPIQIHRDGSRVSHLECLKTMLGEKDKDGRRRPEPVAGSNFIVAVDSVVAALGEGLELPFLPSTIEMSGPVIKVDELGRTSLPGVYAGGDATTLSRSVVNAIASGKRAALGIDLFLRRANEKEAASFKRGKVGAISMRCYLAGDSTPEESDVISFQGLNTVYFTPAPHSVRAELPAEIRIQSFDEANLGLSKSEAIAEAERCFHCGHCTLCENCYIFCPDLAISFDRKALFFTIDRDKCKVCGICICECPRAALVWKGEAND